MSGSAPKINNSFGQSENLFFQTHLISPGLGDSLSISPDINQLRDELTNNSCSNNIFENNIQQQNKAFSMSPCINSFNEIGRLRDELANKNAQILNWEEQILQATKACEAWKLEVEESNRKVKCKFFN